MRKFLLALIVATSFAADAQNVGVGTTTPAAKLDITSSNSGILIPRVALTGSNDVSTVPSPVTSTLIYNTAYITGAYAIVPGFYYWSGSAWIQLVDGSSFQNIYNSDGTLTGNRSVSMGNDNLSFDAVNGNLTFSSSGTGNVIIGNLATATGTNAIAIGGAASASGNYSTAIGQYTQSSNTNSVAIGSRTVASGDGSTAMGSQTTASGGGSFAMGNFSVASGLISTAMGNGTTASGDVSTSMGVTTTAASYDEVAIGAFNTAYTPGSTVGWASTDRLFGIGNGTSAGATSDALVVLKNGNVGIGTATPANKLEVVGNTKTTNLQMTSGAVTGDILVSDISGNATWTNPSLIAGQNIYNTDGTLTGNRYVYMGNDSIEFNPSNGNFKFVPTGAGSVELGFGTVASGNSAAIGTYAIANGSISTALGNRTQATASYSTAMGSQTTASGTASTAMGNFSIASGQQSTAMGSGATASGNVSTAIGSNTSALSYAEIAVGAYNTNYTPIGTTYWAANDRLFGVGNGTAASTSDALVILKNGNVGIGYSNPTTTLQVNGKTSTTTFQMTNGAAANYLLQGDASGNATWVNPNTIAAQNIYNTDGTLTGTRTVTMGVDSITFSSTNGSFRYSTTNGNVEMGNAVSASGGNSVAAGFRTVASGGYSTALGFVNYALGNYSTTFGANDSAVGNTSFASGYGSNARSYLETSLGSCNTLYTPASTTAWNTADRLFGVGNGANPASRSDAMVILKSGYTGIGTANPLTTLDVNGGALIRGGNTNTLTAPVSAVEFATGRQQNGTLAGGQTTADIAFQYGGGGFRHFIQTRHFSGVGYNTNAMDFYLNNSNTSTGSSAPGTGNVNIMTLTPVGVGVNTNAPAGLLDVKGSDWSSAGTNDLIIDNTSAVYGPTLRFNGPSHVYDIIGSTGSSANTGAGYFGIWDNTAFNYRMVIAPTGDVGIGNTSPAALLEVGVPTVAADTPEIRISSFNTGWNSTRLSFYSDRTSGNEWRPGYIISGDNNPGNYGGRLDFVTNGLGSANKTSKLTAMSVYNGMVGIGILAPAHPLDVVGDINTSLGFTIAGAATSGNYLRGNGTNFVSSAIQAGDIPSGSGNYIENQTTQQTASFNISGSGLIANTLGVGSTSPTFNTANGSRVYVDGYDYSDANVALIKAVKTGNSLTTTGHSAIMGMADNYGGSGVGLNVSSRGVCGYTNALSGPYTWGVAGYRIGTVTGGPSAGVMGAVSDVAAPTVWGALGYQDASSNQYGMFATGNGYVSGSLGVGIAPAAPLEVSSTGDNPYLQLNTTATNKRTRINFSQSGTIGMEIGTDYSVANVNDLYIYNRATGSTAAYFYPGNQIWMSARATNSDFYMNNVGHVGFGTTSPGSPIDAEGNTNASGTLTTSAGYIGYFKNSGTTQAGAILTNVGSNVNGCRYMECEVNGTEVGCLYGNGANALNIYSASDMRLKKNIRNTSMGIGEIMQIPVRDYEWNAGGKTVSAGFIAQELYKIYPDAVLKGGEGDLSGQPGTTWMVNYASLTPLIIKSIQDQQHIIEEQKAQIEALQNKNDAMSAHNSKMESDMGKLKASVETLQQIMQSKAEK